MIHKKESVSELELQSNSLSTSCSKSDEAIDTNLPLIMQKSSSLTNLLNANFSSDEDDEFRIENSKELLSSILQRRE
jgi:hypothetical protein